MKFFMFHLMPYRDLPDDFEEHHDSAWVWVPNELYDPETGAGYYREYLDQLAYAEELGFDGVCVNEHHQNAYGLMPRPNLIAAAPDPEAAPADLDPRGRLAGDDGVRRPPPLRVHGHPVLPHRLLQEDLQAVQAGVREGGLPGAPRADGAADADLRGRDRRGGAPRVRGALLVLPAQADPRHPALPARLHERAVGAADLQGRRIELHLRRQDVGRRRGRVVRDGRLAGDRLREARRAPDRPRRGQAAHAHAAGQHAVRQGAGEHDALRRAGHAPARRG